MTAPFAFAEQAEAAWHQGLQAERAGRLDEAHAHFRQAHDLVVACPRMHQRAHQHLCRINLRRRAWRELGIDLLLLMLAPFYGFELVAHALQGQVLGGKLCKR
jgi:hypothetical protein